MISYPEDQWVLSGRGSALEVRGPAATLWLRGVGALIEWSLRGRGSEAQDPKGAHGSSPSRDRHRRALCSDLAIARLKSFKKVVPTCPNPSALPYAHIRWLDMWKIRGRHREGPATIVFSAIVHLSGMGFHDI